MSLSLALELTPSLSQPVSLSLAHILTYSLTDPCAHHRALSSPLSSPSPSFSPHVSLWQLLVVIRLALGYGSAAPQRKRKQA